eukprot:scaffold2546_cov64-Cyclotella_meneghiniana.AAC.3
MTMIPTNPSDFRGIKDLVSNIEELLLFCVTEEHVPDESLGDWFVPIKSVYCDFLALECVFSELLENE